MENKDFIEYTDEEKNRLDFYQPVDLGTPMLQELFYRFFIEKFIDVPTNIFKLESEAWFKEALVNSGLINILKGVDPETILQDRVLLDAVIGFTGHPTIPELASILEALYVDADVLISVPERGKLLVSITLRAGGEFEDDEGNQIETENGDILGYSPSLFSINPQLVENILNKIIPVGVQLSFVEARSGN